MSEGYTPRPDWLLATIGIMLGLALAFGIGYAIASATVEANDTAHLTGPTEALQDWGKLLAIALGSGGASAFFTKWWELRAGSNVRNAAERRQRRAQTLSLAEHLETFAYGCAGNLFATFEVAANRKAGTMMMQIPDFPNFPDRLDWQVIDPELAPRASAFRNRVEIAKGAISSSHGISLGQGCFYAFLQTSMIGKDALAVAAELRNRESLPQLDWASYSWNFGEFLTGELEKEKTRYREIFAAAMAFSTADPTAMI